jgi:signal transduction histidine kinase
MGLRSSLNLPHESVSHLWFLLIAGIGVWATIRLLWERRERHIAERHQLARLAVTRAFAESATLDEAAPRLFEALCESEGWDWGAMWQVDRNAGLLYCAQCWHSPSVQLPEFEMISRNSTFPRGVGLPGRVWATGQPAWISDVVKDPNFPRAPTATKEGLHAAFCFPILQQAEVLGVMEFFSHRIRPADDHLLAMMAEIGGKIGNFIARRRSEDALRKAEAALVDSKLSAAFQIAASVAHELRNPLGVIRNSAYYLRRKIPDDAKLARHLEIIEHEITASDRVIEQLLHFGRPIVLQLQAHDLRNLIQEALALLKVPPAIKVSLDIPQALPAVMLDKDHFRGVLLNLFRNAIQAMENGGELRIHGSSDGEQVRLMVSDTGKGIPPDQLDRIFEPFFTTKAKGIGLGLAISKQVMEQHHGRIEVHSDPPGGTKFLLALPLRRRANDY